MSERQDRGCGGPGEGVRVGEPMGEAETRAGRGGGSGEGAQ